MSTLLSIGNSGIAFMEGVKRQRIEYKGQLLSYIHLGEGKELLFCIHGFADKASIFLPLKSLSETFQVVAIDLPFHGESEWNEPIYRPEEILDIYRVILNQLGFTKAHLLAHSMGTRIATSLALNAPELCDELILCAPAACQRTDWWIEHIFFYQFRKRIQRVFEESSFLMTMMSLGNRLKITSKATIRFFKLQMEEPRRRRRLFRSWLSMALFPISGSSTAKSLYKANIKLTVFCGDRDRITPLKGIQRFANKIPNAKLVKVKGNHFFVKADLDQLLKKHFEL